MQIITQAIPATSSQFLHPLYLSAALMNTLESPEFAVTVTIGIILFILAIILHVYQKKQFSNIRYKCPIPNEIA